MTHYWVILASDFIPHVLEVITNPERHSRSHLSSLARHKMKTWKKPKPENITEEIREKEAEKIALKAIDQFLVNLGFWSIGQFGQSDLMAFLWHLSVD